MSIRDKAIDTLSIHADLDDPTGTSIALDVALEVTMALVREAQADAWEQGFEACYGWEQQTNGIPHDPPISPFDRDES